MSVGALLVARTRSNAGDSGEGKNPRKSRDKEPRPIVMTIRGRDEWKQWVKGLAEFDRSSLNELVDRALARYAREIGYKVNPPER